MKSISKFILRIEDTDKDRSKKEFEDNIIDSLKWLGLQYDEFYRQSDRTEIYKKYIRKLIADGFAYVSKETPKDDTDPTKFRSEVIRFKNPNRKVIFNDLIRGKVEFDTTELGDFVIAKSEDEPVFHLVVVIDDFEMGVTHVIRGEDHISNTPRQILIYEAIGATIPAYAHIPLLLAKDRSKLSKRNGAVPVTTYREQGFLPEAVVNYLTLLGWHPKDDKEILSFDEIIRDFSLERVQKGGAIFDIDKLRWFNREYITRLSLAEFSKVALPYIPKEIVAKDHLTSIFAVLKDKVTILSEITTMLGPGGELHFVHEYTAPTKDALVWKKNPDPALASKHIRSLIELIAPIQNLLFSAETIKTAVWSYVEKEGKGDVLWPFRMAVTGQERSPDPFVSASLVGKTETLNRLNQAISILDAK